jgi:hypothetical protein
VKNPDIYNARKQLRIGNLKEQAMKWALIYISVLGFLITLWLLGMFEPPAAQAGLRDMDATPVFASADTAGALVGLAIAGLVSRHIERKISPRKRLHGEV